MTPGYDGWKDTKIIKNIKPCVLNNGEVQYYLQKDNYTLKEDGTVSVLDGTDGDVMIEIPKIGYRLWNDENYQYVSVTEDPNKDGYCYYAHSLNTDSDCNHIYIGAYLGYQTNNMLYSRSGVSPTASTTLPNFRTYSSNRGTGYSIISFFPWTLLQCLYVIIYKNLDSQTALGKGYTSASSKVNTGATNENSFCYGTQDGTTHMKFLGIEDMWGNLGHWLDGVYCDSSWDILTDYRNTQFTESNHNFQFSEPSSISSSQGGYIKAILGTNNTGFIRKGAENGASSTYFSDNGYIDSGQSVGYAGYAGGSWRNGVNAGAFCLSLIYSAADSYSSLGSRLMYKHKSN